MTLYFQVQFVKAYCRANAKNIIKYKLKKKRLLVSEEEDRFASQKKKI